MSPIRTTNRSIAMLGAAGALAAPTAIALADEPPAETADAAVLRAELTDEPTVRAEMRGHLHERLLRSHARAARKAGERHADAHVWSNGRLRTDIARLRKELRARHAAAATTSTSTTASAGLEAIAACESGGNPRAIGGGGTFRGKYQFTYASWSAVGGSGDPAAAPEAEQDRRAAMLMARSGAGNWPVCGS